MNEPIFVFVGGLHRSGTTMLAQWLSGYRHVSGLTSTGATQDEGQFLQDVFPDDNFFGGPGRFGFDRHAHATEALAGERSSIRQRLCASWLPYAEPGTRYLVEKSPGNLLRFRHLASVFPDARHIAIMRHPVAVTLATRKWSRTSLFSLIAHWVECHQRLFQDLATLDHAFVVSYEHLIGNPGEVISQLEKFLCIDERRQPPNLSPSHNNRYFAAWRRQMEHTTGRSVEHLQPAERYRRDHRLANRVRSSVGRSLRAAIRAYVSRSHLSLYREDLDAQDAIAHFEEGLLGFGYSLVDFSKYPQSFEAGTQGSALTRLPIPADRTAALHRSPREKGGVALESDSNADTIRGSASTG